MKRRTFLSTLLAAIVAPKVTKQPKLCYRTKHVYQPVTRRLSTWDGWVFVEDSEPLRFCMDESGNWIQLPNGSAKTISEATALVLS